MSNVKTATMLATCALAGSAAAAMVVLESPVRDANLNQNAVDKNATAPGQSALPMATTQNHNDQTQFVWPSLNDTSWDGSPPDLSQVPVGVDSGINDRVADVPKKPSDSPQEMGGPVDCVCVEEYFPGDIVVATVHNPQGNTQIPIGAQGTVVCGNDFGGGQEAVLVEWNITNGHNGNGLCSCPGGAATAPLGFWVFCTEIAPLCGCEENFQPGDTVYATVNAPEGNGAIKRGDAGTVVCRRAGGGGEDDIVLVEWSITNGHQGISCLCPDEGSTPPGTGWEVRCHQVTRTPPVDCACPDDVYFPGEIMYATVDSPSTNAQISAGDPATVACGDDVAPPLLGAWNINNGHNGLGGCECPLGASTVSPFGWWVNCDEVHPLNPPVLCGDCDGEFGIGDVVWARLDSPQGQPDIKRGQRGVVVCGFTGSPPLLVQWDGLTTGHNGNGNCDCPGGASADPGTGFFVQCDHVSRTPVPCPGDTDFDGDIDVTDLLRVLTDWGPCAGCTSDMNGDDVVNVQDLLIVLTEWGNC